MIEKIKQSALEIEPEIVQIRRHLHRHPELSCEEFETGKYIETRLREWGIECSGGWAGTGVVAVIKGRNPEKRCVALRADMDALPVTEETGLDFASENPGVMHACGHDVHMACLLGAGLLLHRMRGEWEGTVKLIFQPAEEDFRSGAPVMIKEGVLQNPAPQAIYALHILPEMEAGKIGWKKGQYMASTDELYLDIKGRAGHGATPELNVDPVVASAYVITALQQIVSRQAPPYIPTVLSFGRIIGEGRTNIIPGSVHLEGTLRTFNEEWRSEAHRRIERCARHTAAAAGAECTLRIDHGYPFVYNREEPTETVRKAAVALLGEENVEELPLRMTAEDFAYYAQEIPGCMFRLGVRPPHLDEAPGNLHTSRLTVDESCIKTGIAVFAVLGMGIFC